MRTRKLKILIISKQYPPVIGGGGSQAFYLANELSRFENVYVHVLTSTAKDKPTNQKVEGKNLFIHRVDFGHTETFPYEGVLHKSLKLFKDIKPHIIHGQHLAGAYIGCHLKASFNKPFVVTLHKTPMLSWDPSKIKDTPLYSHIKLFSQTELIDRFITGSRIFKQELTRFKPKAKIELIHHGIPIQWYKEMAYNKRKLSIVQDKLSLSKKTNVIVCPSRLDEKRKELDIFVKAAGLLCEKISDKKFLFLITGNASNPSELSYKEQLETLANSLGIKKRLKFESFKFDEMPALYAIARACILPSITEGLGLALVEALSLRTPVIGTNTNGIKEVIRTNGKQGLRFEVGDHEALSDHLYNVFTDANLRQKIKREGFKRAKSHFDAYSMARKHIELYTDLIK